MAASKSRQSRKKRSLVQLRGGAYFENFSVAGYPRFRRRLGTSDRDQAEALAAATRAEALAGKITGRQPEITLGEVVVRHWNERAQHWRTAYQAQIHNRTLIKYLGADTILSSLSFGRLSAFVAERRAHLENSSVNRELAHLRAIVNIAGHWGYAVPQIAWRHGSLWLDEPENKQTILPLASEEALFAALRPDFHPVIRFTLMTGVRRENALCLRWDQIDWDAETITFRTKSKKPTRKLHVLALTQGLKALLARERGNHPEFVFTYLCQHPDAAHKKGERYPLDPQAKNLRRDWERARVAIGLPELRIHDLRHTAATRMLAVAPLDRVQRLLGHSDIRTTARYLSTSTEDLRAAMEAVEAATGAVRLQTVTQNLTQRFGRKPKT